MTADKENKEPTPFERMMEGMLQGEKGVWKVEDIHPEDFQILLDSIVHLFFNQKSKKGGKVGIEGFADYDGTKIEFSKDIQYTALRKDRTNNFKIIVLPDNNDPEEAKQSRAQEALKEFDCLEGVEKYELCLRIFKTFSEPELIILAKQYDPLHRDTKQLEQRLRERARRRAESTVDKK